MKRLVHDYPPSYIETAWVASCIAVYVLNLLAIHNSLLAWLAIAVWVLFTTLAVGRRLRHRLDAREDESR